MRDEDYMRSYSINLRSPTLHLLIVTAQINLITRMLIVCNLLNLKMERL